jgi:GAF domain-containing protein/HAMP domain-containing protein
VNPNPLASPVASSDNSRQLTWLWISALAAVLLGVSEFIALQSIGSRSVWAVLPLLLSVPFAYGFWRAGKQLATPIALLVGISSYALLMPLAQRGVGIPAAMLVLTLVGGIALAALPRKAVLPLLFFALAIAIASILLDVFGAADRPAAALGLVRWILSVAVLALFVLSFARVFLLLDLRTKIVAAILGTGGVALATLAVFAVYQTGTITTSLVQRLDESVNERAKEQLLHTASVEASRADQEFGAIAREMTDLAGTWRELQRQKVVLNQEPYWDASTRLVQLEEGQYGNRPSDVSSVFLPAGTGVDDAVVADLNVSAYLDFSAPAILEQNPSLLAVYAIDLRGAIRYYPNINLAEVLPPDFDATSRPYFEITGPMFNPERIARWSIPYLDATGGGLVVTVAVPVYEGDRFTGVVAADMQLNKITGQISTIQVGQTGYAFLLDDAGRILSMPPEGYDLFGIRAADINSEEFFKQTVLGLGNEDVSTVTRRMVAGAAGVLPVSINNVEYYVAFAPIRTPGYSIGLVVPVSELQGPILAARSETDEQLRSAAQVAATILIVLLCVAIAISIGLGNVIAAPITRLTQVATQVSAGDLTAQADATTQDEIGTLAQAFNSMTSQLRETLAGLERRVEERTSELMAANERNERRARQFEAIAQVARTISSTRDLDTLLSQITEAIHREFGYYHVGIFLLDAAREYAVLSAANSEGGKVMLENGHRLKVGETGLVGFVTRTGKARVALDTGADAVYFNNPYLPDTRSELTLPLQVADEIIGALDVQSTEPGAFSQEDITILSTLADQVSIAIQNARQFEETRKALKEAEVLSRQFIQTGWQNFTKNKNLLGLRHTGARASILYRTNGKEQQEEDLLSGEQRKKKNRGTSLSLPIQLHGEVIGSVEIHAPDNRPWDQDELDIVVAIIERAAIAMENARLLAESQKRAAKERTIGEISSKISMQAEVNELLKAAALELGRALPDAEIAIQFNKEFR